MGFMQDLVQARSELSLSIPFMGFFLRIEQIYILYIILSIPFMGFPIVIDIKSGTIYHYLSIPFMGF